MNSTHVVVVLLLASARRAPAQEIIAPSPAPASSALKSSNLLNPNISAIGWFQGEAGQRRPDPGVEVPPALQLKEAELGLQSVVDPYAKADFFISVRGDGGVDLEEGVLTWHTLPYDLQAKVGKFRADLGKFNRIHPPETPFADRPLVHERFFGAEGLAGTGGALSWHVPNPWLLVSLDAEVLTSPKADDAPAFDRAQRRDLLYVTRLSGYYDLTEAANATLGGSYAYGPAGQQFDDAALSSHTFHTQIAALDFTLRWKNPRRAIYRSLSWQNEAFWSRREAPGDSRVGSAGAFSHVEFQFARRWKAGARYDYTQLPADRSRHEQAGLVYLTFTPSEFSLLSLQGRQARKFDGRHETLAFLKITFNIGPHGAHPF